MNNTNSKTQVNPILLYQANRLVKEAEKDIAKNRRDVFLYNFPLNALLGFGS